MANGPKCADNAQKYILQTMRDKVPSEEYKDIIDNRTQHNGEEETSIGSVFEDGNLREFEERGLTDREAETAVETFENLDKVYEAVKTTDPGGNREGYSKLEGLKAFSDEYDVEMPTDNRKTRNNWVQDYLDAGLVDVELDKTDEKPQSSGELTELGHSIIESTEELDEAFAGLEIGVGDFYRKMVTSGYGSREANTGGKIQAFFMYGGGMNTADVSRETDVPESTLRTIADYLTEEGVFTDNRMFTAVGREVANTVIDQLSLVEPEEPGGNIETNLGQDLSDFFEDGDLIFPEN